MNRRNSNSSSIDISTFCFPSIHIPVVDLPEGFRLHSINYMVKGVCRECAARMK